MGHLSPETDLHVLVLPLPLQQYLASQLSMIATLTPKKNTINKKYFINIFSILKKTNDAFKRDCNTLNDKWTIKNS